MALPPRRPARKSGGNLTGLIVLLVLVVLAGGVGGGYWFLTRRAKQQAQQDVLDAAFKETGTAAARFFKGDFNSSKESAQASIDLILAKRELETKEQVPEADQLQERAIGYFWLARHYVRRFIEFRRIPSPFPARGTIRWTVEPPEPPEQAQRRDEALKNLRIALDLPKDTMKEWHEACMKGLVQFLEKKYDEAEKHLALAVKDPDCDVEVRVTLAHALFEQGKYAEADRLLAPLIEGKKLDVLFDGKNAAAKAIHFQALQAMQSGRDPSDPFARAVKLLADLSNPLAAASRAEVLCDWGSFKASQGRGKEAEATMADACHQVAGADVSKPEMCISYARTRAVYAARLVASGDTTLAEKNFSEGLQILEQAANKYVNDADLISRLGRCGEALIRYHLSRDKMAEAQDVLKRILGPLDIAIGKNPIASPAGLHLALARAWVSTLASNSVEEAEKAMAQFAALAEKYPKDDWVQMEAGHAWLELGDRAVAEGGDVKRYYEGALAGLQNVGSPSVETLIDRGRALLGLGTAQAKGGQDPSSNYDKAVQELTAAAAMNPLRSEPLGLRAMVHGAVARWKRAHNQDAKGSEDSALQDAEAALKINQEVPEIYLERAKVHIGRGQALQLGGQDPTDSYKTAMGELAQAINYRKSFAEAFTTRGEAAFAMAEISRAQGKDPVADYRNSIDDMTVALGFRPKMARAYVLRGLSQLAIGEHAAGQGKDPGPFFKEAMFNFDKVASYLPGHPDGYAYRAYCRVQQGLYLQNRGQNPAAEFDNASADIEKALQIDNRHADALFARGTVAIFKADGKILKGEDPTADLVGATADLSAAFDLNPRAAVLAQRGLGWLRLAEYQRVMGQPNDEALGKAESDFTEAIKRDGRQIEATINRGAVRAMRALALARRAADPAPEVSAALEDGTSALKVRPFSSEAFLVRGQARLAAADYLRAKGQDPLKDFASAIADFDAAVKANSTAAAPALWKAWTLLDSAEYKERREEEGVPDIQGALKTLNDLITQNGTIARAYQLRAWTLLMGGLAKKRRGAVPVDSYADALKDAEQAVTLNGTDPFGYAIRGAVRYHQGDWERLQGRDPNPLFKPAFEDCNKAGSDPTGLAVRGLIYYRAQEWAKALADFKAAAGGSARHAQELRPFIADCEKRK